MPRNLSMPPESTPRTGPSLVATTGAPCFAPAAEAASTTAASARLRTRPDELSLRMTRHSDCVSLCEMQLREWVTARQSIAEVAREMGGGGLGAALGPLGGPPLPAPSGADRGAEPHADYEGSSRAEM